MRKRYFKRLLSLTAALVMMLALGTSAFASGPLSIKLPSEATVRSGETYTISVSVSGSVGSDITYSWYSTEGPIPGAPNSNVFSAKYSQNTSIYCVVQSGGYIANSNICNITVIPNDSTVPSGGSSPNTGYGVVSTPTITKQPAGTKLLEGQSATLSVGATCANLGNGVALQYQWYVSSTNSAATATPIPNASSATYTTPPMSGDKYYLVAVWSTNGSTNSSIVYSNIVAVTYGTNQLAITKHPTGETVKAGESALFIARADNAVKREWRIVSKDTTRTVPASQAAFYFNGLGVSGETTDTLSLTNIPADMNGWSVECKFTGADGSVLFTRGAILDVQSPVATPSPFVTASPAASPSPTPAGSGTGYVPSGAIANPSISNHPAGAVLSDGQSVTLSVAATGSDESKGITLKYQWYQNSIKSNANGTPISGATGSSYVPENKSGSMYYYVGVTATDGSNSSKTIYSNPAEVTYSAPISTPTPSPAATAKPDSSDNRDKGNKGLGSMLIAPIIAIVAAAAAIGVGMFFLLKGLSGKKDDRGYYYENDRKEYYRDDEFDRKR